MNTSEAQIVEKPKRKNKPQVDRYSQNEAFAVIVFSLAATFFFWLDELIGAVYFERAEALFIVASVPITLSAIVFLHHRWRGTLRIRTCLGIIAIFVIYIPTIIFWLYLMSFISIISLPLSIELMQCLLLCLIVLWIVARYKKLQFPQRPMKLLAYSLLILAMFYSWSQTWEKLGGDHWEWTYAEIPIHTEVFVLQIVNDRIHSEDAAFLYRCNSYYFACQNIFSMDDTYYSETYGSNWLYILQLTEGEHDNVLVLVDGEVVFDSSEGSEE